MKCKYCLKEYQPQRKSSQFCSTKCRVYSYRNKPVTLSNVTLKKDVTLTKKVVKTVEDLVVPKPKPEWEIKFNWKICKHGKPKNLCEDRGCRGT